MPAKRTHKRTAKAQPETEQATRKIVVKSHIRSIKPDIIKKDIEPAVSILPIDKHVEKPVIKRQRKTIQSAVNLTDSIKEISKKHASKETNSVPSTQVAKRSSKKDIPIESSAEIVEQHTEIAYPIHSISKLVLSSMIHLLKGNLSAAFKLGNLSFTADEILHHSSGIIDGTDKRLYSKYDHINKPIGIYSNEAFNFLAKNLKSVIGMSYKQGLNELNSRLGTRFTSNGSMEEIGAYDLSGSTEDLNKLGEYIKNNYNWFANGTVKRPGRGVDIITPSGISNTSSMGERGGDVKITITTKKVIIDRATDASWTDRKYIVQQKTAKTKIALDFDNKRVTDPVISQPLNLPFEYVTNLEGLTEIDGAYWRLVKTVGRTKYYQSPIVNSRRPFLLVTD
jgi:hypothetical protein